MRNEARAAGEQSDDYRKRRTRVAEYLNCEQRAADRANNGVDRVPDRIYPWDFIGEKFEEIENTSDRDDPRVAEDFQRLILWRQSDPVKMDGESGNENGQVKIDAGERGQTESDSKKIKLLHLENIDVGESLSRVSLSSGSNDEARITNDEIIANDEA